MKVRNKTSIAKHLITRCFFHALLWALFLCVKGGSTLEGITIEQILEYFVMQGPFAVLFVWMLYTTQKRNKEREDQLYETLNEFASRYDIVIEKLDDIKGRLPPR